MHSKADASLCGIEHASARIMRELDRRDVSAFEQRTQRLGCTKMLLRAVLPRGFNRRTRMNSIFWVIGVVVVVGLVFGFIQLT
jgi:hypothetical protein